MLTVTVSQLNRYVKAVLEEDRKLKDVYVKGEVAGFVRHTKSGHCYFKLADGGSAIRAVMFRQNADLLGFEPADGMAVLARASIGVFERDGAYQLYVTELVPDGAGAIAVALAQRKERLEAMGVFDSGRKKPVPTYPSRVGVATSRSGAAIHDIRTVIGRRWPLCTIVFAHTLVQGPKAPESLCHALKALDKAGCDVIILSRGGGSAEDLWSFNDEELVLTLSGCKTPVISAVGHETDFTLCDFAADARAATPSAAAVLAVPDRAELLRKLGSHRARFFSRAEAALREKSLEIARLKAHPSLRSPKGAVAKSKEMLDIYYKALYNGKRIIMQTALHELRLRAALLDSFSPLRVLDRGYCLARKDNLTVGAGGVHPGDELELLFADGSAGARVFSVNRDGI